MNTVDGIQASIRIAKLEDAEAILVIHREVIAEKDYFISVPEEFEGSIDEKRKLIEEVQSSERDTLLVAEVYGKVVGWLLFKSATRQRMQHTGTFGVMIHKDHRGAGVGKDLINELLNWAEQNPLIEKVSLGVFSSNHRAIALYKSLGFVEEGRKIREFKMGRNEYVDDV